MKDLNALVNETFPGLVVRKDLVKLVKGNAVVPSYVLEYLLGQYCASNDEETIKAGIENVKEILRLHYVNRNEAELIKSTIKERGHHKVIDKVGVELNAQDGVYEMAFSNLGIKKVPVDDRTVKNNEKLLVGGVWCLIDVEYEVREERGESPWSIRSLKPIQMASFDRDEFIEGRGKLETDVWIDTLLQSIGLNPEKFGRRNKFFQLMRLVPFCERNYNLIELGPKGTGKSHVYSECSPHGMLLSGGEVTLAKLFVNNATGKLGLVGYWDCIAFDEFAGKQKRPDKSLVDVMKNYMANKTFSRGIETLGAEASIAFVGNTMHSVPQMLKKSNLFEQLPDAYLDSAFIDRIHNYIPGWEVDIIRGEMFSSGYGFIIDYLSEVLHSMRELDYTTRYQKYFTLSPSISTRDKDGVQKTFSGLMKIVYPSGDATKEEIKELLTFAMEGRKRVKDQLFRIDPTYDPVDFSFTDNETGAKISVKTLEEVQYPNLYGGASEGERPEPTSPLEVDAPDEFSLKDAPRVPENRVVEILENQTGVDYECLFGACLEGVRQITITDPFIRTFYQARNLMEFMEMLLRHKTPEDELSVILRTTVDDFNAESQQGYLNQIKESCGGVGIEFVYSFEDGLHDRSIVTDTGWFMTLGRGLDIYQPCDLKNAFAFASRVQSQRPCKAFTVTYHR